MEPNGGLLPAPGGGFSSSTTGAAAAGGRRGQSVWTKEITHPLHPPTLLPSVSLDTGDPHRLHSPHLPSLPPHKQDGKEQPYILLVNRGKSRLLYDNSTETFEEIVRVLREEGGLKNVEAVRMEDISEVG